MLEAAPGMVVTDDTPTNFTLKTPWMRRTQAARLVRLDRDQESYVAYHIMPLYVLAALNDAVPPGLEERRQNRRHDMIGDMERS